VTIALTIQDVLGPTDLDHASWKVVAPSLFTPLPITENVCRHKTHDDEDRGGRYKSSRLDEKNATPLGRRVPAPIILFARLKVEAAIVACPP
jgi:hypothetical protein